MCFWVGKVVYNNEVSVGIIKNELMCRIDPNKHETETEKIGSRTMDFTKKTMKGYPMADL